MSLGTSRCVQVTISGATQPAIIPPRTCSSCEVSWTLAKQDTLRRSAPKRASCSQAHDPACLEVFLAGRAPACVKDIA